MNSPFAPKEPSWDVADFTVVLRDGGDVLGRALLWGIDRHNRFAHIGLALRPLYRGQGYGTEVVAVLCSYGFCVLGLHRLQIETLADNAAMIAAAAASGFQHEGTLRRSSWVDGSFADDAVFGLLDDEWIARSGDSEAPG
jgi:RimJ/RimL family protein N-acetyltransferase